MERLYRFSDSGVISMFKAVPEIVLKAVETKTNIQDCPFPGHFQTLLYLGRYQNWMEFPIIFRQYEGKRLGDVIETGWPGSYLISDLLKETLEKNELTGWKTYPVLLYDNKHNLIQGYHGLSFIGYGGYYVIPSGTPVSKISSLPIADRQYDVRQWDGSDFFTINNATYSIINGEKVLNISPAGTTYVTKRAMLILKNCFIATRSFHPITDFLTITGI